MVHSMPPNVISLIGCLILRSPVTQVTTTSQSMITCKNICDANFVTPQNLRNYKCETEQRPYRTICLADIFEQICDTITNRKVSKYIIMRTVAYMLHRFAQRLQVCDVLQLTLSQMTDIGIMVLSTVPKTGCLLTQTTCSVHAVVEFFLLK